MNMMDTLAELDEGRVFNSTHRLARELIAAGLAYEDAGRLRITEAGRCAVRRVHFYRTTDEHVANLEPELKLPRNTDGPMVWASELKKEPDHYLLWSRDRAQRAAGVANGKTGVWTEEKWVLAFMEAYEQDSGSTV